MRAIIVILSACVLTACAQQGPNYQAAENSEFTRANHAAIDRLVSAPAIPIERDFPLLVATMVNIDSMKQSSRLGRLVSEQYATRLTQLGYHVVEMKLREDVYIREGTGELLLSRDVRDLAEKHYNAQVVVVGSYAVASGYVYLTLKAVTVADNRIIAAVNYLLPLTDNNRALLSPPRN